MISSVRYVSAHLLTGMKVMAMFCWINYPCYRCSQKFMGLDCVFQHLTTQCYNVFCLFQRTSCCAKRPGS
ncbi:hypothetical protein VIGAN_06242700 [Vigna angularis var. angularis]|uniref:Uncharacterized protein n=1 Tax=Vigna angularis var. angularis TaxID=157739 RepID=A0A0S3SE53_PHAAN|nr:hypothetical protein VIGAN_06242700 [Vigna angularis var. angularis]